MNAPVGNPLVFVPSVRMVLIHAQLEPPDDDDQDGYSIAMELCPVIGVQRVELSDGSQEYGAVFVCDGEIECTGYTHDRSQTRAFVCPWPPEEDAERLKDEMECKHSEMTSLVDILRLRGEPIWHGWDINGNELPPGSRRTSNRRMRRPAVARRRRSRANAVGDA